MMSKVQPLQILQRRLPKLRYLTGRSTVILPHREVLIIKCMGPCMHFFADACDCRVSWEKHSCAFITRLLMAGVVQ